MNIQKSKIYNGILILFLIVFFSLGFVGSLSELRIWLIGERVHGIVTDIYTPYGGTYGHSRGASKKQSITINFKDENNVNYTTTKIETGLYEYHNKGDDIKMVYLKENPNINIINSNYMFVQLLFASSGLLLILLFSYILIKKYIIK